MIKLISFILVLAMVGCGKAGPQGSAGVNGLSMAGPQGVAGVNGQSCTVTAVAANAVAPNGGSLIACPDNSQSLVLNGAVGETGPQGNTGEVGPAGTSGSIITAIQFCPGTTVYPTTFSELGFCIQGVIYAVYSANSGFLTEIVPGTYSSDGINSSCTFTVAAGCKITQN